MEKGKQQGQRLAVWHHDSVVETKPTIVIFLLKIRKMMGLKETFYISHGSPTLSIDDSLPARHFLKSFKEKVFNQRPNSILVISGHWETSEPTVNVVSGRNETIYDFYGFPKSMYKVYPKSAFCFTRL
ncbi:unnamed protein product [Ilex paraguariensis]|uniref:Extradiol ring-cleavage dioxygenase class III enzyme subunit B domain-containing protein n=1 Tax=Ilex paraguariensis TaxID=185542 RepID=A0ABC8T8X2_9AQUA